MFFLSLTLDNELIITITSAPKTATRFAVRLTIYFYFNDLPHFPHEEA